MITDGGFIHEYYFGETLKTEVTHNGVCAEVFKEELDKAYTQEGEVNLTESLDESLEGFQIL